MTEPADLDAVLNDAARVMYTGTGTLMERLATHCRSLVDEVQRLRPEQAERETRLGVKAFVARCEALAAEVQRLRAENTDLRARLKAAVDYELTGTFPDRLREFVGREIAAAVAVRVAELEAELSAERERCARVADACAAERRLQAEGQPVVSPPERSQVCQWLRCKESEATRIADRIRKDGDS